MDFLFAIVRILIRLRFFIGPKANVHTGAPPPWLKANEHDPNNLLLGSCGPPGKGKSRKLNPKRVGAAWAERRRAEMEMEKRGELVPVTSDSSWLPNFGGVWQSGTRKESKKDFEKIRKLHDKKSNHELSLELEIKPYISKRMVSVILTVIFHLLQQDHQYNVLGVLCHRVCAITKLSCLQLEIVSFTFCGV